MNDDDTEISDVSDDEEINNIVKKNKKPLVIINKIDNGKVKKQGLPPQPTAIFV
jgi:predicted GTPase